MQTVNKPWGYEKWITEEGSPYFLKEIFMQAGKQSSLQVHERKEETNYILKGRAVLQTETIREIWEGGSFHIRPGTVHRVTALTDLLMIEASTPEVDDIIRIEDNYGRGDGRIEDEHK